MIHSWIREYLLLAMRIDRAARLLDERPFVDYYYGPTDLKTQAEHEAAPDVRVLLDATQALTLTLPEQGFVAQRAAFLARHLAAMATMCRLVMGQEMTLAEEIEGCLGVTPTWHPEARIRETLTVLGEALPGPGSVQERFRDWQDRTILPPEKAHLLLPLMQELLAEARRRTQVLIDLPAGEALDIELVRARSYGAANWYLGGCHSRLELNVDRPVKLLALIYQMCHEAYPGHHTDAVLKEQHLYQRCGYDEQSVFIVGPQLVISEGIASLALEMIFTAEELASWTRTHVSPLVGIDFVDIDLSKLFLALSAYGFDDYGSNLVMLRRQGASPDEVMEYALTYTLYSEEQVQLILQSYESPLMQIYAFTYSHGKRLLQSVLQGENRLEVFRRLLTEPVYPSLVREWFTANERTTTAERGAK